MNKTQRATLFALTAQATRTEAEAAVLAQLQALAAQHPDPSKDTDATATAAAAATTSTAAVVTAAKPGTVATVVASILASVKTKGALGADLARLTAERDTAVTALATEQTAHNALKLTHTAVTAQLAAFCAFFALKPESLAGQTAEQLSATLTTAISATATAQLATMGVPAGALPAPNTSVSADSKPDELFAEYAALANAGKSEEAAAFFAKHITPKSAQSGRN